MYIISFRLMDWSKGRKQLELILTIGKTGKIYERSLLGSGASPNGTAAAQFVRAEMLPSGYFIWPCKDGGSIIHKVDMLVWISCQAS
ncbi:Homeobox-leucine zipper protein REVOLUTA [Camellia lanceoleosa]|uniref:Homeobox-leucine zipper protein REVOLUTA n=1 Tax=Camellia lanceoleosa TaxID=1840588 RepID=A0ACC0IIQ8_9ERIC|nr:Homeobox-leucine zipper protein REVOLUTA [Camellia lanceoleosa]